MSAEVLIFMSEGALSHNFIIGDSSGTEVGRLKYPLLGNSASFTYLHDANYSFHHRFAIIRTHFDFIDENKVRTGSSREESQIASASTVGFRGRIEIASPPGGFRLQEDGMVCLMGSYEAQFRILASDGSDEEGQLLGKITTTKSLSRDFYLTCDSIMPIPIRFFCFALAIDRLRAPDYPNG